jgi:DNA-binding FrmR family transcriptional regulator
LLFQEGFSMTSESVRHASHLPADTKEALAKRLKRIEGQVRGLQRMVDEERYCADVMVQIASAQEALAGVGRILLQNHLRHCTMDAIRSGDSAEAERVVQELMELWAR